MALSLRLITLLFGLSAGLSGHSAELTPFLHYYEASYEGLPFNARGTRSLERRSDGRFQFETTLGALSSALRNRRPLNWMTRVRPGLSTT